jgi:hypothetical protein
MEGTSANAPASISCQVAHLLNNGVALDAPQVGNEAHLQQNTLLL